jgi:hypothetical protein
MLSWRLIFGSYGSVRPQPIYRIPRIPQIPRTPIRFGSMEKFSNRNIDPKSTHFPFVYPYLDPKSGPKVERAMIYLLVIIVVIGKIARALDSDVTTDLHDK